MKKIWTVAFCEDCCDFHDINILGLFSSEDKAVKFAEKRANEFFAEREAKRKGNMSAPVKTVGRFNGANCTRFKMSSGSLKYDFCASLQEYASDEDAE